MTTEESDFSLKESFEKIGALPIPKFADQNGKIIDGIHRDRLGVDVPTIKLPIKNPLQFHMVRLVVNKCRRTIPPEEISQELATIAQLTGWTPTEMAKNLPFSYSWIMKYLPVEFKNPAKAKAGRIGGLVSGTSRASRHEAKLQDDRSRPPKKPTLPKQHEQVIRGHPPEVVIEASESEKEFAERFTSTFKSHIAQLIQKDMPTIISHMSEEHNCDECQMKAACSLLLHSFMALQEQLPICMKKNLGPR
jgi:hypothetical protein